MMSKQALEHLISQNSRLERVYVNKPKKFTVIQQFPIMLQCPVEELNQELHFAIEYIDKQN